MEKEDHGNELAPNSDDEDLSVPPEDDDEGPICSCCWLPKWRTSWDLRLGHEHWDVVFQKLTIAAKRDCQDCEFLRDAILAYVAPETSLSNSKTISIKPYPNERRLYIHIKPKKRSKEHLVKLEVFRFADRWPSSSKTAFADSGTRVWDIATKLPDIEDVLPSSRKTFRVLNNWIAQCGKSHRRCTLTQDPYLPNRVLELAAEIVCIREYPSSRARYACLSHCWGATGPKLRLTSTTYDILKEGLPISDLPATFRDTVSVCQSLQISFLWIDALCIKQDDIDDWTQTAAQMASIYENAFVTLGATYAIDSNGGLFAHDQDLTPKRLSSNSKIYVKEQKETSQLPLTYRHFTSGKHARSMKEFPLLLRAWVYQERRLSQRFIHFTQRQILWECKSCFVSEDKSINTTWEDYAPQASRAIHTRPFGHWTGDPIADWKKTVSEYQGLQLTYESDRLPAIAALAERMMRLRHGEDVYIAGMWKNTILSDLCWYHFGLLYPRSKSNIPSWSWASILGNIMWADIIPLPGVEVLDVQYTPVGPANIGEATDASITIRGRVLEGKYVMQSRDSPYYTEPRGLTMVFSRADDFVDMKTTHFHPDFDLGNLRNAAPIHPGHPLTGVIIYRERHLWTGIMLRKVSYGDHVFERVGLFSIQRKDYRTRLGTKTEADKNKLAERFVESLPLLDLKIV